MKSIWSMTIEDYLEVVELAKKNGKKEGDSMEEELFEVMRKKGKKPIGNTELTKNEWLKEQTSQGKSVLDISVDDKGNTKYKINKKD